MSAFSALRPLRRRDFGLLWSGGLVSIIGSWMQTIAVGALVTARTGQVSWAAIVAAGAFLPIGIFSPLGGALADRLPRRAMLVTGNVVQTGLAALLAVLVGTGHGSPLAVTVVVTVQGVVSALILPFQQAILPELVPPGEILAAASLNSAQYNLGRVVGPVLAGITVAAFGYPVAFVANAVSFLAVVLALVFVRLDPPPGRGTAATLRASMRAGARAAWEEPGCRAAIGVIGVVALLASPFIALIPAVAQHLTDGGERAVGSATAVLTTAQGIGAVLGALALAPLADRFGRGTMLMVDLCLLPVALVAYGLAGTLGVAVITMAAVGLVYIGVLSGLSTIVQLRAPSEYRGRVLSLYLVALGVVYPLGALLQGFIADRTGLRATTCGAAGLLVAALALIAVARPAVFAVLRAPATAERAPSSPGDAGTTTVVGIATPGAVVADAGGVAVDADAAGVAVVADAAGVAVVATISPNTSAADIRPDAEAGEEGAAGAIHLRA